jgi:uncharacterized protein YneF (UPF0154 family)
MVELLTILAVLVGAVIAFAAVVLANLIAFSIGLYVVMRAVQSRLTDTLQQTDLSNTDSE